MTAWSSRFRRALALILLLFAAPAAAVLAAAPKPIFIERFAYDPADLRPLTDKWFIADGLAAAMRAGRIGVVAEPGGQSVLRVSVHDGDALAGAKLVPGEPRGYVCDGEGSRALQMEAAGGVAPSERSELQLKHDRATGAGELVRFGETIWYRFDFKLGTDWPSDGMRPDRVPCRTVIHQIKQDAFRNGASCSASPFFKVEARPSRKGAQFFAQVTSGTACTTPPAVRRVPLCIRDVPRDVWVRLNVRLHVAQDDTGRADVWLDGLHCGSYHGPMGDPLDGARRDGRPIVNAQPRFGIYRDWRAETQTIYFDHIAFWNADPSGHPDWGLSAAD